MEGSAAAGETTVEEEEQEKEQKEASGAVPTCVLSKWYLKNKKEIKGNVNNHPKADEGAKFSFTLSKPDRQRHLQTGLTIYSTTGRPYLLGAPKPSKKEKEEEQQEEREERQEEERPPVPTHHEEFKAEEKPVPAILNNWYWKNEKWISGTVANHPRMDQGAQVSLTMAKSDRQKHLKPGLTIYSTHGRPYLLGAPKPFKKEKEGEQ